MSEDTMRGLPFETKAYVCTHVADGVGEVRYVSRPDGDWCVMCEREHPQEGAAWVVAHLGHVVDDDPTVREVLDLEENEGAERTTVGGPWVRKAFDTRADELEWALRELLLDAVITSEMTGGLAVVSLEPEGWEQPLSVIFADTVIVSIGPDWRQELATDSPDEALALIREVSRDGVSAYRRALFVHSVVGAAPEGVEPFFSQPAWRAPIA